MRAAEEADDAPQARPRTIVEHAPRRGPNRDVHALQIGTGCTPPSLVKLGDERALGHYGEGNYRQFLQVHYSTVPLGDAQNHR